MSDADYNGVIQALSARFPAEAHKTRPQGGRQLTYLSIDAVLNRLNDVLGTGWSNDFKSDLTQLEDGGYLARCEGYLTIRLGDRSVSRYGVGAMVNRDPDMALKTALAEAIKKAGHAFGIGLYLWDEDAREAVGQEMARTKMTTAQLKRAVYTLGLEQTGKADLTAAALAKHFGTTQKDLNERDVLLEILKEAS